MRLLLTISLFLLTFSAFSQRGIFRKVETDIIRMRTMGNADSTLFLTTDSTGHIALKKISGSASPYHLPYNADTSYYLGGDSALHKLPAGVLSVAPYHLPYNNDTTYVLAGDSTLHKLPTYTPFDSTSLSSRINQKQNKFTLTTTGQSGPSEFKNDTLNIPNYFFATNAGDSIDYSFSSMTTIYNEAGPGEAIIHAIGVTAEKDNLNFPFKQIKALDVGGWNAGDYVSFSWPTAKNSTSYTFLRGFVRLKQAVPIIQSLSFQFFNAGVAVSQILSMVNYGLDKSKVDVYQNITIPMSAFGFNTNGFDEIRLIFGGGSSASGLYLDLFQFQNATVEENKYITDVFRSPGTTNVYEVLGGQNKLAFTDSIGTPVDTTSLSNRINLKLNATDTASLSSRINLKEPIIAAGTTSQYWRGDKTWQTLNTDAATEATNKYYTDTRARAALTLTTNDDTAATYNNTTGRFNIPHSAKRFGIEDNTSAVDRSMDMQGHIFHVSNNQEVWFEGKSPTGTDYGGIDMVMAEGNSYLTMGIDDGTLGHHSSIEVTPRTLNVFAGNTTGLILSDTAGVQVQSVVPGVANYVQTFAKVGARAGVDPTMYIPVSVNGHFADATGNITVSTTGGSTYTDAQARAAISLTTTGTSGAATYNNSTGVLNVPQYASSVGTITWLGTAYNINSGNNITLATPTTSNISEGSNLYYTDARARAAISVTGSGTYDNTTGVINITGGSSSGWALGGNSITNSGANYLGTTNNTSLRIRSNGVERMSFDSSGDVRITSTGVFRINNTALSVNSTGQLTSSTSVIATNIVSTANGDFRTTLSVNPLNGTNTGPVPSAALDVNATNRGVLFPRIAGPTAINKQVVSVAVTNGGSGYTSAPSVTFGGVATATATISGGSVTAITVTSRGGAVTVPPTVSIGGGGGSGAAATATIDYAEGTTYYCTTHHGIEYYNGTSWQLLSSTTVH